ncbi:MAG: SWIM zinc finger family protein [Cytophagales bacterium]|nr:SWIM zinc finger family protein [Cytophagales bacterium]
MLFNYKYGGTTSVENSTTTTGMNFSPDTLREPTFFVGSLQKHIPFREAISALHDIVVSDLRFKPKDREEYKEWLKTQEEVWLAEALRGAEDVSENIKDIQARLVEIRKQRNQLQDPYNKAVRTYFDYLYKRDYDAWFVLDPVITVHPDEVFFECFSQDESSYGKLSCNYNVFKNIEEFACGTTNIDYSAQLYNEFQKIRDYKETQFSIDPSGFDVQTTNEEAYKEVKIDLPESWVRGFLQVSSAMTLDAVDFDLHPMDLYNVIFYLKRNKEKDSPRSMKYILEPNRPIRIVLEPWNYEIVCKRSIYQGDLPKEIRTWGRRRLLTLERLLPITKSFKVTLLGTGMPSFYVADLEDMTFTLGMSGWTANDWSKTGNFDLMNTRHEVDALTQQKVFLGLKEHWFATAQQLSSQLSLDTALVKSALNLLVQEGKVIFDLHLKVYRLRELSKDDLPIDNLRFSSEKEKRAYELLEAGAVSFHVNETPEGFIELSGTVKDGTTYRTSLVLDNDFRMKRAHCECFFYYQNELRKGPCEHILALRMAYERQKM